MNDPDMVTWWENLPPADQANWCEAAMARQVNGVLAGMIPSARQHDWLTLLSGTSWVNVGNADATFGLHDALIAFINANC